jgi:hypothetical protein
VHAEAAAPEGHRLGEGALDLPPDRLRPEDRVLDERREVYFFFSL